MTTIAEEKLYAIHVDGEYVCDVSAVNQPLAVIKARNEPAFKEVIKGKQNQTYIVTACRTKGEGQIVDTAALL